MDPVINGQLPVDQGITWKEEYGGLLEDVAATNNATITPWPQLRSMIRYRIQENTKALPLSIPRRVVVSENDTEMTAAEEEASRQEKLQDLLVTLHQEVDGQLGSFSEPPFTIQRLAELAASPAVHYRTSIKYMRALHRTVHVSSGTSVYVADTYALASGPAETAILGQASTSSSTSSSPLLRSSASPSSSPLLSPIPWMAASSSFDSSDSEDVQPEPMASSSPHMAAINGHDASLAEGGSPALPTASPTGGRVDELDPLPPSLLSTPQPTGMTDHPEPITDPQGSPPRNQHGSPDLPGSPTRTRRPSV